MTNDAFVFLITGPAGAGKTTAAEAWATASPVPAAHVSLDTVRQFLKSGYVHPPAGWNEDVKRQAAFARDLCATIAARYVEAGICCVIDDVVAPDPETVIEAGDAAALEAFPEWDTMTYARWTEALGKTPHTMVVLLPSLDRAQERNGRRTDSHRLTPRFTNWIYRTMVPWASQSKFPVIDNTNLTVEETVVAISKALATRGFGGKATAAP